MLKLASRAKSTDFHLASDTEQYGDSDYEDVGQPGSKKIKPVDGLVLKTPIAFQKDSDLDMIPIRKEGMAVCEKCGAIGVKHSFYTKERRFCSQACAKSVNEVPSVANSNHTEKRSNMPPANQPTATKKMGQPVEDVHIFSNKKRLQMASEASAPDKDKYGYDWVEMLTEPGFVTPLISCFRHSPLCDTWASDISVGMKVEIENTDTRQVATHGDPQSYWVASVISLMGYKAQLRYEGFGNDDSKDFWVNLAGEDVHPVGWCASKGKPLIPPRTIQDKYTEWREFLVKRLTGARSLPNLFHSRFLEASRSRFRVGMTLELIDRNALSTIKVATVDRIVGRRLRLRYTDSHPDDMGFWCHEESSLIHPVGWALSVGHPVDIPQAYRDRCTKKVFLPTDATSEMFSEPKATTTGNQATPAVKFKEGMKLEAVDPLNLDTICVATVVRVLRQGYLMIRIDRAEDDEDEGIFCYHSTSACIAPPGFCGANAITLKPPEDYEGVFRWGDYLRQTKATAAPEALFGPREDSHHTSPSSLPPFRVGMRVEAADLMDSRLVCVATIAQVAGRLVRVHFDGWSDEFDQWMDASSPEIYPVGWCELAGYRLETPVVAAPAPVVKKPATVGRKAGRGGRGRGRGTGRGVGRPPRILSPQGAAGQNSVPIKRDRSPSTDDARSTGRQPPKTLKLAQPVGRPKSQTSGSPSRSLRPRGTTQPNNTSPPPADDEPYASVSNGSGMQRQKKRTNSVTGLLSSVLPEMKPAVDDPIKRAQEMEAYLRTVGRVEVQASSPQLPSSAPDMSAIENPKRIPRLMGASPAERREALQGVTPMDWTTADVSHFLRINDCVQYSDTFSKAMVDGQTLLSMTKEQVLQLTHMKLGPSVKIHDLICALKTRVGRH